MNMPRVSGMAVLMLLISFLFSSCDLLRKHKDSDVETPLVKKNWKAAEELMNIDKEFAAYSRDSGLKKAYLEFLDEEAVMLRPNHYPLVGTYTLDFVSQLDDRETEVSWEVRDGEVAGSDDLGFTYGVYTVIQKESKDTVQRGTYAMVWKKNKEGLWKVVMDNGSPGVGDDKDTGGENQ